MPLSHDDALEALKSRLLTIKATGDDGFEGLIAGVAADLTQLTFRLAKSGSQFGRDASTTPGPFAISLEAKRYSDEELRLEVLAGKLTLAAQLRIDLWIIGTTSTVGDDTLTKLQPLLTEKGIALVCLDWAKHPLPPLAVALAAAPAATRDWFNPHCAPLDLAEVDEALRVIASHPSFTASADRLRAELSAPSVGLGATREHSVSWFRSRLDDTALSQQTFGQIIRRQGTSGPTVARLTQTNALEAGVSRLATAPGVVVVQGDEGVGKTWVVAQWWDAHGSDAIVIVVAGRRMRNLEVGDPLGSLARLLAEQDPTSVTEAGWRVRLDRWKSAPKPTRPRLVLVLDGINEHPLKQWADLISELAREVHALGGVAVVTTRPTYWSRDLEPRLRAGLAITAVVVPEYNDSELDAALRNAGIDPASVPPRIREFMRNPRVCSVATSVVKELAVQPDTLTVETLLFEYWRARLRERGDLVAHSAEDFQDLLRSHASNLRDRGGATFSENTWHQHSGAAERKGREAVSSDYSEIVEGRFLRPIEGPSRRYEFRPEVLPFALGLLVTQELWESGFTTEGDADNAIGSTLEPIAGFGLTSQIIAAAVAVSCLTPSYPDVARRALIRAWFSLQNKVEAAEDVVTAHFLHSPTPFVDVLEDDRASVRDNDARSAIADVVAVYRDDQRVLDAVASRIPRWLAQWSRRVDEIRLAPELAAQRQARHEQYVERALSELTDTERARFDSIAIERADPIDDVVQRLAVVLLANHAIAPFATALLGWAFTQWIGPTLRDVSEDLAWIIRCNGIDPQETRTAVNAALAAVDPPAALGQKVTATLLRLVGDEQSSAAAERAFPRQPGSRWRRSDQFCDVNPYDPAANPPGNLDRARSAVKSMPASSRWAAMSHTAEEYDFESAVPALARFAPKELVAVTREVVRSISSRTGIALRQLVWHILDVAPVFDPACSAEIRDALNASLADPTRLPSEERERHWILSFLFAAARFDLDPAAQRGVLGQLPEGPILLSIVPGLLPLPLDGFEAQLRHDAATGTAHTLALTCLYAPSGCPSLTNDVQSILLDGACSDSSELQSHAAGAIERLNCDELDLRLLARVHADPGVLHRRRLLDELVAIVSNRRSDYSSIKSLSTAAVARLAGRRAPVLDVFADKLETSLTVMLTPHASPPDAVQITVSVGDDRQRVTYSAVATDADAHSVLDDLPPGTYTAEQIAALETVKAEALLERAQAYEQALDDDDGLVMLAAPDLAGLQRVIDRDPARAARWVARILGVDDRVALRQVRTFALALGATYARHDAALAAALLDHVAGVYGVSSVTFAGEKVPLWLATLFYAPAVGRFAELREREARDAYSDAALEDVVVSAEYSGEATWLEAFVDSCVASDVPGLKARGITMASLRRTNDHSDAVLSRDWGDGFLSDVAAGARKNYRRAQWARHWLEQAFGATDAADFWRLSILAEGIADRRIFAELRKLESGVSSVWRPYSRVFRERLARAQEERSKKRSKTLFFQSAPAPHVVRALTTAA